MSSQTVIASHFSELKNKIEQRLAQVAVIGMGYVGLPLALLYSEQGFPVTGFDIDERKVSTLNAGGSYIFRITAPEIQRARSQGLTATSNYAQIEKMDAVIICVPTPLNEYHEPDLSYISGTAESHLQHSRAAQRFQRSYRLFWRSGKCVQQFLSGLLHWIELEHPHSKSRCQGRPVPL